MELSDTMECMKYSGILAIIVAWLFVAGPTFTINGKKNTISEATKKYSSKIIISIGLVFGSFLQFLFLLYLNAKFGLNSYSVGSLLYILTNIATVLVAVFTIQKNPRMHTFLVRFYFIVHPISLFILGVSIRIILVQTISSLLIVSYAIGAMFVWQRYKKQNAYMEEWAFLILSLWVLFMTFVPV